MKKSSNNLRGDKIHTTCVPSRTCCSRVESRSLLPKEKNELQVVA